MTPKRFAVLLDTVGWSAAELARRVGYHAGTVKEWRRGTLTVPFVVAYWLEQVAGAVDALPAPQRAGERKARAPLACSGASSVLGA